MTATVTVAQLKADIERHRRYWPSTALGTACEAVAALQRLIDAEPSEFCPILDELRGGTR
jgi:hypothetical protein